MPCGSTIGPLTATRLGIATIDVGIPTLSMHSARELAGTDDPLALTRAMEAFLAAILETRSRLVARGTHDRHCRASECRQVDTVQRPDSQRCLAASYPFATIDPNIGVVGVPDPRWRSWRNSSIPTVPHRRL